MLRQTTFRIRCKYGARLPVIGETYEAFSIENKSPSEYTMTIKEIMSVEWDMRYHAVIVRVRCEYTVDKQGLTVV